MEPENPYLTFAATLHSEIESLYSNKFWAEQDCDAARVALYDKFIIDLLTQRSREFQETQSEVQLLREIVDGIFGHAMLCDVRGCRCCGVPIVHMEHLRGKRSRALELEAMARKYLRRLEPKDEDPHDDDPLSPTAKDI